MENSEQKLKSYRLLTTKEVGEYLKLSEFTVTKYRKKVFRDHTISSLGEIFTRICDMYTC